MGAAEVLEPELNRMVPRTILSQLSRLRWQERRLRLVWGAARWVVLAVMALAVACFIDWLVDLRQDTPMPLRRGLLVGQLLLWTVAAVVLLVIPLLRRLSDSRLALWIEERTPGLGQ